MTGNLTHVLPALMEPNTVYKGIYHCTVGGIIPCVLAAGSLCSLSK